MASVFEQRAVRRKFVYFGIILLLFTGSLLHRKLVIQTQAERLMLRDVGRGKADLTDAAVRLTLSGLRGLAVTSLWMAAIEKQQHHEWNDLELIVDSLTRLQPRFISPWIYQGWNLAFNVSVECDRVRDKYYYITRGITLLCRGDEKNDPAQAAPPQPWPANPDLRFEVASSYHRKIGSGDESKTLRCLFDLSCIPPAERNPDLFYMAGPQGRQINLDKFKQFCESYPRLVRRLRERLFDFKQPETIVQFLADNMAIPTRLSDRRALTPEQRLAEFPILPPQDERVRRGYPDWRNQVFGSSLEDFDVFVAVRAWHTFAQIPLPPPDKEFGVTEDPAKSGRSGMDRLKYRLPRFTAIIFRQFPVRSQTFIAEELQKDGWFDDSGWRITDWFDSLPGRPIVIAGAGSRFNSALAWSRAFDWYKDFGVENGMYIEPDELNRLRQAAKKADPYAVKKVMALNFNLHRTRFNEFIQQAKVERTPEAVSARKAIFEVEKTKAGNPNVFNIYHAKVLPQWLDLLLRNPEFRQIIDIQEASYELQAEYFAQLQRNNREAMSQLVKEMAYAANWPAWPLPSLFPHPGDPDAKGSSSGRILRELVEKAGVKVLPIRSVEGLLDQLFLLVEPDAQVLGPLAVVMARQALWPPPPDAVTPDFAFARFVVWPPPKAAAPNPEIGLGERAVWPPTQPYCDSESVTGLAGVAAGSAWPRPLFLMLSSAEQRRVLTRVVSQFQPSVGIGWTPLIPWEVVRSTKGMIPWMQPPG